MINGVQKLSLNLHNFWADMYTIVSILLLFQKTKTCTIEGKGTIRKLDLMGSEPLYKAMLCLYRHTQEILWAWFQTTTIKRVSQ